MGWDEWDGMSGMGVGWDGMGWDGVRWDGIGMMGWNGMGWLEWRRWESGIVAGSRQIFLEVGEAERLV